MHKCEIYSLYFLTCLCGYTGCFFGTYLSPNTLRQFLNQWTPSFLNMVYHVARETSSFLLTTITRGWCKYLRWEQTTATVM